MNRAEMRRKAREHVRLPVRLLHGKRMQRGGERNMEGES